MDRSTNVQRKMDCPQTFKKEWAREQTDRRPEEKGQIDNLIKTTKREWADRQIDRWSEASGQTDKPTKAQKRIAGQ